MGQPCSVIYPERRWLDEHNPEKVVSGCTYSHGRVSDKTGETFLLVEDGPDKLHRPLRRALVNDTACHVGGRAVIIAPA